MSKRQEILDAIVDKLKAVGVFGDRVYRSMKGEADLSEFPAASVLAGDAVFSPLTNRDYVAGSQDGIDGWNIHVVVYGKAPTGDKELAEEMERLIEITIQTLLEDVNLGLSFVQVIYLSQLSRVVFWENNIGMVEFIFQVKYDFEKTNP